jgi:hypothetical protein
VSKRVGRPPLLDDEDCADLITHRRGQDLAKNSATSSQLQTIFYEKRVEKAKQQNKNSLSVKQTMSKRSLTKYRKLIVPDKVKSATVQNKRRLQASTDLPSFISAAGLFMSLFSVDLDDSLYIRVRPELIFDIDAMSVKVGPQLS